MAAERGNYGQKSQLWPKSQETGLNRRGQRTDKTVENRRKQLEKTRKAYTPVYVKSGLITETREDSGIELADVQ